MYCTATGKAILAYLPEEEIREVWNKSKIVKLTKKTNTDFILFKKELQEVKKNGYAIDDEENEIGVKCVGAPIFDMNGDVVAAISVTGPVTRITDDKIDFISNEVMQCTSLISKEMGYKLK